MLTSPNADPAFRKNGFSNWKKAMEKKKGFQKHESSDSHMEAVARYVSNEALKIGSFSNDDGDARKTALENKYLRNCDYLRLSHLVRIL